MPESATRLFIVISGLPGSGKSTLARRLAPLLNLCVIDKDDILERLFDIRGTGDASHRRQLSRESDLILQGEAAASNGAILVSFWQLPGMLSDSGTPTYWLPGLSNRVIHIHCECPPDLAAQRFVSRRRHPGHLDHERSEAQILASIQAIAILVRVDSSTYISVDTTAEPDVNLIARKIE